MPNVQVLAFDAQAAYQAGKLRAHLRKKGQAIDLPDLQIAAIAIDRGLTLVTGNVQHFIRIPDLKVENWIKRSNSGHETKT